MIDKFFELFDKHRKLTDQEREYLEDNVKIKFYKKNEMIFTEGRISSTIYFILDGCVRLFYNVDGREKTAYFYTEGKFVSAGESYTYGIPSKENFQALEDTFLILIFLNVLKSLIQIIYYFL